MPQSIYIGCFVTDNKINFNQIVFIINPGSNDADDDDALVFISIFQLVILSKYSII